MRLSRLYSNRPEFFGPIEFNPGLNVVLGEIRLPENRSRSIHNLGKTTLAKLIDFCLLLGRNKDFFLFRHECFQEFVFYIEIATLSGEYVTVRRSVQQASKIDIAVHKSPKQDFTDSGNADWNHRDLSFERGLQVLDAVLGLTAAKPWPFRQPVSYALRTQKDFGNVFQLGKFLGKHRDWKPYVAHILGFDSLLVQTNFDLAQEIEDLSQAIATLKLELGAADADLDELRGLIKIKSAEVAQVDRAILEFDLELQDAKVNKELVEQIDHRISQLNGRRYVLSRTLKRLTDSLNAEHVSFRTEAAKKLFEEAGQIFPDQLKKQFDDLLRFNAEISAERLVYLRQELVDVNSELDVVNAKLAELNDQRRSQLRYLGDGNSLSKFREMNEALVSLRIELESLKRQADALGGIREKDKELRSLERRREDLVELIEADIDSKSRDELSRYSKIRSTLNSLTERFLGHKSLIVTRVNNQNNIEFDAEYLSASDRPTSEDEGKSYKQVLCAAYDLAVAGELLHEDFIRFIYHDGLLEGLDPRVAMNIVEVLHEYSARGVQQILTVLDSDLPFLLDGTKFRFDDDEVILHLHDEGASGRLFRFDSW
jgi:uncharacterized protein YydD (DUF2326 family)